MSSQEIIRDVPADKVDQVVADFIAIGASAEKFAQANGLFMVVATFAGAAQLSPKATAAPEESLVALAPAPAVALPPVDPSKKFADLAAEYLLYFDACRVAPAHAAEVSARLGRLMDHAPRYQALGDSLGVPWFFIGIVHSLESGANFATHLHNGDPLTARTVHVPAGRPADGQPPFTWEASARDALAMRGLLGLNDWSTARILYRFEGYNGFGYRARRMTSPYLWSFSQLYTKGRFVADHEFDPESVSRQCGAAVLLKALQQSGH